VVVVAITGVGALLVGGRFSMKTNLLFSVFSAILYLLAGQSPVFQDGMEAFSARWETATTDQGGFKVAIVDRVLNDLFGSFSGVTYSGLGTGFSTNVGRKALPDFGLGASEGEWGRLLYDNGFILGSAMIVYRIALAGTIVLASLRAWRRRSPLALLFIAACFLPVLIGQWGQTTTLGSAIIGGGLTLAAATHLDDNRTKKSRQKNMSARRT
jgi:hypothetical protein